MDDTPIAKWRAELTAMRADVAFQERQAAQRQRREASRPQIAALIRDFREGRVELEALRQVFDTRTRTDWDVHGLKGLSGAMFLNTLVKHLPKQREEVV